MSLINEALKKAQRVRNQEETDLAPTPGGTVFPRVARRGQPRSAKSLILIATGAVVLFVLSVVATVYVINRPDPVPTPATTTAKAAAPATVAAPGPSPIIAPPVIKPPVSTPATIPVVAGAPDSPALATPPRETAPTPTPKTMTDAKPDERVHAFVDSIRVMGIRSSGDESRVLMNDRVFRVNEIVDRGLDVRLTGVEPGTLTFTDANGVTYKKAF